MVSGPGGFAGDVVAALAGDFAAHGAEAIAALRERNPNAYLRLCASVLRHKAATRDPLEDLTDAQLAARLEAIGAHLADVEAAPRPRRVVAKDAVGEAARGRAARSPAATGFEGAGRKEPGDDLAPPLPRDLGRRREDRLAQRRGDDPAAPGAAAPARLTIARDRSRPRARTEGPAAPSTPSFPRMRDSRASWTPASAGVTTTEGGSGQSGTALARDGRVADRRNGAGATPRRPGASVAVRLSVFTIVVATLSGIAAPAAAPALDVTAEEERRILRHAPWPPAGAAHCADAPAMGQGEGRSKTKLAVGAETHEIEMSGVGLAIDQDQVGPDMTVPVVLPGPRQGMVEMAPSKRPVGRKVGDDVSELRVEGFGEPALLLAFVVSFEGGGPPNRPHSARPSARRRRRPP